MDKIYICDEGAELLARGIIVCASKDLKFALKKLKNKNLNPLKRFKYETRVKECRLFFRGQWIKELTNLDGEWLLQKIEEDADED